MKYETSLTRPAYVAPLAAFCLVLMVISPLRTQQAEPEQGRPSLSPRLWQHGAQEASVEWADPGTLARLRAKAEADGEARDWLALGAALLHTGDWEGATNPLRHALESADPGPRTDAEYDLALAYAVSADPEFRDRNGGPNPEQRTADGEADEDGGTLRDRLIRARDGFRAVLRENPGAEDARWNLELVDRWLDQEESGGDAGGGEEGGGDAEAGPQSGGDGGGTPMTAEEAQRLLDAAANQEREVQSRRRERNQGRDPRLEKNW